MRIKYILPFAFTSTSAIQRRAAQVPCGSLHPETEVDCVSVRNHSTALDSHYGEAILEMYITEAGLTAEKEGYSAVVMDTVSDSGLYVLRSRLTIPVVGPGAVSYAIACLLGKKFSLLAYKDSHRLFYEKTLVTYGLAGRCASIHVANVEPDYERLIDEGSDAERRAFVDASWAAVRQDGADAIVLGSTTMHPLRAFLAAELNVPVIDPGPLAIRIAEMLVQMGLSHSKVGFPAPTTTSDEMWFALPSS